MVECTKCRGPLRYDWQFPVMVCQMCGVVYYLQPNLRASQGWRLHSSPRRLASIQGRLNHSMAIADPTESRKGATDMQTVKASERYKAIPKGIKQNRWLAFLIALVAIVALTACTSALSSDNNDSGPIVTSGSGGGQGGAAQVDVDSAGTEPGPPAEAAIDGGADSMRSGCPELACSRNRTISSGGV